MTASPRLFTSELPLASVLMPVRNEARFIERALKAVLAQDYPSQLLEVLVVDGMSTDGTREIVKRMALDGPRVRLLDNRSAIVPAALNIGLREATGEVIIRVDGHCEIARDYVRQCVKRLAETGSECVGGPISTVGGKGTVSAISLAMSSPFGVGNAHFRTSGVERNVDTVAFGAYRREVFESVGLFDEEFGCNEDDEFNLRLTQAGGKILLTPAVRSAYYSRASFSSLWKQYFRYGMWKVRLIQKRGRIPSLRSIVPPCFVLALTLSLLAPATGNVWWTGAVLGPYAVANLAASAATAIRHGWQYLPLLPLAFATLHLAYGVGFWAGVVRFGVGVRRPAQAPAFVDERD